MHRYGRICRVTVKRSATQADRIHLTPVAIDKFTDPNQFLSDLGNVGWFDSWDGSRDNIGFLLQMLASTLNGELSVVEKVFYP